MLFVVNLVTVGHVRSAEGITDECSQLCEDGEINGHKSSEDCLRLFLPRGGLAFGIGCYSGLHFPFYIKYYLIWNKNNHVTICKKPLAVCFVGCIVWYVLEANYGCASCVSIILSKPNLISLR